MRVRILDANDLAIGGVMNRICDVLQNEKQLNDSINDIIEKDNIGYYIEKDIYPKIWTEDEILKNKQRIKGYKKEIGIFCGRINENNFVDYYEETLREYKKYFWNLLDKYKVYNRINDEKVEKFLKENTVYLHQILNNRNIVRRYGRIIRDCIVEDSKNVELLLNEYEVAHLSTWEKIYFPEQLTIQDKEELIRNYISSNEANINYLKIISNIKNKNEELVISNKTRLLACKKIESEEERILGNGIGMSYGASVSFVESLDDIKRVDVESGDIKCFYSIEWIKDNLDFNTLLNNFIYLFEYVDQDVRINFVNKSSQLSISEKYLFMRSKGEYTKGITFTQLNMLSDLQLKGYYHQLKRIGIRLEDVCTWFFEKYLFDEFNIKNYRVNMPSENSTYLEKCRTLLSELDSILKQFGCFVLDNEIDHELIQISSDHLKYKECNSLVDKKYIYANKGEFERVSFYLFSNQCMLSYIERLEDKYDTFIEVLLKEKIYVSDISEISKMEFKWLLEKNYLKITKNERVEISNIISICILKDLYDNEVISYWHKPIEFKEEIHNLMEKGLVIAESELFSHIEQDYLNFHMNKATFNNSLDLRNRYTHGTQPNRDKDIKEHEENYMIFLKIMILIIIKINDDICIYNSDEYNKYLLEQ